MVYLYATSILDLQDPLENPEVLQELPNERQKKILNCKQKQKRLQSLAAGRLLQNVLSQYGISSEEIYHDENGKPMVPGIYFNLAHSGEVVVCAVSEKPVGCDIERIKEAPKRVVSSFCSTLEKAYLKQFEGEEYNRAFFRIWTKKESYLKMIGIGIRVPLNNVEVQDCYIQEYLMDGYQITVCAEENDFAELCWKYF
jgi:4'-phosphopantetheinyl transferase